MGAQAGAHEDAPRFSDDWEVWEAWKVGLSFIFIRLLIDFKIFPTHLFKLYVTHFGALVGRFF